MICIECAQPADCLFTVYSNKHIQLTDCLHCQKVVDRYVEFDNVLLFIDLLLLKSGAYRHLVYNSLDHKLSLYVESKPPENGSLQWLRSWFHAIKNWLVKFDKLNRVWLLLIAFEIYLTWVIEERSFTVDFQLNEYDGIIGNNPIMERVFSWNPLNQYLYFTIYCVFDIWIVHNLTRFFIMNWIHWGQEVRNAKDVLSYAILLSYGAKIFPILMLIWPYDTVFSMNIIKCVANLYIIESLKAITNLPYSWILQVSAVVWILRWVLVNFVMTVLVAGGDWQFMKESFVNSATIYGALTLKLFMTNA
ncbi:ZYRO0C04312p [Zygosaccharomyces rouxii]|uniref:Protein ARV n=1 Tax=Zygosaccharomyces rouxii (strain ATCC 2623 / CBS 732 / NBRC 1130 / NCYC 568 / NRRL Y-229) TaxID=559307 RepID=C5DT01_ZYGRC|nr:uncharacterized protein ZYRO0C04312g [Zygosaccharomyces rouxii]KAH9201899.1 Arv1-like family-domain-containing protein [Zygosaccharomyces rouxii]CAR26912.1 ZYRO0C04312p [Zygosaccharomyces rouxii]